ncbi:MAG: type 4a pilus biogenesis protein PilO [Candidatus Omnitrophica bacterium]|nr:type 4a pilus biogenesis protein PilO [Candidatus Omnitrophota bacterium]
MIKLKNREKILVGAIGALIFIFLTERIFLSGLRGKMQGLRQQIKLEESRITEGVNIEKRKDLITADYDSYKDYLNIEKLPDKELFTNFLKEIESIAKESGISIINLAPQNTPEVALGYKKYNADLRAEAKLEQLFNFLGRINQSRLLIKLDKLSLIPKDEQVSALRMETVISIVVPL